MWYKYSKTIIAGRADDLVRSFLKNDLTKVQDIKNIDVDEKLKSKIYPVLAFFYSRGAALNALQYCAKNLNDILKKYPHTLDISSNGIAIKIHKDDLKKFDEFLQFSEYIDGIHSNIPGEAPQKTSDLGFAPGQINIVKIKNAAEAAIYGVDQSWCISQWGSGMWQSYRDSQASTFYFVFDGTRPENDPLRKVAVDVNSGNVELTDKNNTTGKIEQFGENWEEYFEYLESKGVDTSQFVNDPLTPEEQQETIILGKPTDDLNKFKNWNADYKSKYIGRAHQLTNEQFSYILELYDKKINNQLITQYVNTGLPLPEEQIEILKNHKELFITYNRKMGILIEMHKDKVEALGVVPNVMTRHFIEKVQQEGVNIFGEWDRYNPQKTVELINLGAQWNPEMVKKYGGSWRSSLTSDLIQQIGINPNDLLGKWDTKDPQRTVELINLGAQWNPEMANKYHYDWKFNLKNLAKQLGINPNDPNYLLGYFDYYNSQRTMELINMGAQWNPEMWKEYGKYNANLWQSSLTLDLITQLRINPNDLLGKWDTKDSRKTAELINLGAQWNPEMWMKYNDSWRLSLTSDLIQQIGINPNDLLGYWDRDDPQKTVELINLGVQWNSEKVKRYEEEWMDRLTPDLIQQIGINPNDLLGKWDKDNPQRTMELMNMGVQWSPDPIVQRNYFYGIPKWIQALTPDLIQQIGINPNDLLGKWDEAHPLLTVKLINLGAQWNPEMIKKYGDSWRSSLTPDLIQQIGINPNDFLGKWDKDDPKRTLELINIGAQWNPELLKWKQGKITYNEWWMDRLTPDLIQQIGINPNDLLGKWDRDIPQKTVELINLGAQWNPEIANKYHIWWKDALNPDLKKQLGINPN